ncbi:hypothetical protein T458_27390 [Brevibacillus panacihumi W25]|uniref:Uncharacterized protein n=1 Tax=Brevibacillus panacihumi W25 TaxID=1408254 RepID=V6M275_9BACL|nr:hypothetical protein [Brevibacillus panacihumi]EST52005.1 hypothetical protein T458_27390 [Brevibacillus panacihumi W25]HZG79495.1 hypothetical protein [Brevibacillus sp.]
MLTYFLLSAAVLLLVFRFLKLLKWKRLNITENQMDQHLLDLLNRKKELP